MKQISFFVIICITVLVVTSCGGQKQPTTETAATGSAKKKIVLIPGHDSHGVGEHEHLGGCTLLARLINEHVPGAEAVVTEQGWPKDTSILNNADAIVMYSDGGDRHMVIPHLSHIDSLMDKGVGLVNLHYAVEIPRDKGGDRFLEWMGGYFETYWSVNPWWTATFDSFPAHPVSNGVKPFTILDEWYYHMRFAEHDDNLVHILRTLPPDSSLNRPDGPHEGNPHVRKAVLELKQPQTVAWAFTRADGGRGFGFTGAHRHANWVNDEFRKVVLNAIVWAAKMEVPAAGIETPTPTQEELVSLQKKK